MTALYLVPHSTLPLPHFLTSSLFCLKSNQKDNINQRVRHMPIFQIFCSTVYDHIFSRQLSRWLWPWPTMGTCCIPVPSVGVISGFGIPAKQSHHSTHLTPTFPASYVNHSSSILGLSFFNIVIAQVRNQMLTLCRAVECLYPPRLPQP